MHEHGFTMLELLIVIAVFSAVILTVSSFVLTTNQNPALNLENYAQKILLDLQYAQQKAMSTDTSVTVYFPSGCNKSYEVHQNLEKKWTMEVPENLRITNNFSPYMLIYNTGLSERGGRITISDQYGNQAIIYFDVIGGRLRMELNYNE
ncbi:prepilin-type N-terminal cleavage/methylation domain-containing protein [Proteinivorax hydrogeniformans]|uniref:Prepilin-type N-terminal cleavage/methylation domain-containing protein n=1 Tax=Proteinivorax hydrogeniformans TaxID=1826727 RepID=A0AAU8HR37_9FIRM